jgi:hypothetical protein
MNVRASSMAGWFDSVIDLVKAVGLTPEISLAIAKAELDPTSSNVQAVINAYIANGQVIPGQLMAHLIQINKEKYPGDTYVGKTVTPILLYIAGGAAIWYLLKRK